MHGNHHPIHHNKYNFLYNSIITLLLMLLSGTLLAQEPLQHEKSIYRSPEGKLYINKEAPLYISIGSSPEDTGNYLLKSEKTPQFANPMYLDSEGYNTIRSPWKIDPETKQYVFPKEDVVFELYADSEAPRTTIDMSTENIQVEKNTIYVGREADLQFNAQDEMAGVKDIYYSVDREDYQKYSRPVKLNEEKKIILKYYAVDHVGNAEEPKKNEIVMDLSAPNTNHKIEGDHHKDVLSGRAEIRLNATDKITNVKQTHYSIDGGKERAYRGPLSTENLSEGEHRLTYYSVDRLDNSEEKKEFRFYVDKTPPRVVEELLGNTYIANGKEYLSGRNRLKLISMDNKAGVKEIRYSINGEPFKKYSKPFSLNRSGNLDIEIQAIDSVNNKVQEKKLTDRSNISYVDLKGPKLDYQFSGPAFSFRDTTYITSETNIILTGKDEESGFKHIEYSIRDNDPMKNYDNPFVIKKDGSYSIEYSGYDNLENTSVDEFFCTVDNKGPEIFHRFSMNSHGKKTINGKQYPVYPEHVVLFLSASDSQVGFANMHYSINGSNKQSYKGLIKGFKKGSYDIKVTAEDKLGNQRDKEIHFYIE